MSKKTGEELLDEMLSTIRKNPGIRPSELNRQLHVSHSWRLRSALIKKGLIRKEKRGAAVYYYPQK